MSVCTTLPPIRLAMMREWRKAWDRDATYRNLIKSFLKANKPAWAAYIRDMFIAAPLPTSGSGRCMDNNFKLVIYTHITYLIPGHSRPQLVPSPGMDTTNAHT